MKVMKKSFPYRIKGALLSVLGAGIMGASCNKTQTQVETHDTVYNFGRGRYSELLDLDQIRRSADSIEVRNIIFQVRANDNWSGENMPALLELGLQPAFDATKGKGKGRGTFTKVSDYEYNRQVEAQYKALGFGYEYINGNQR